MNKKGFTLVELIAVIAILVIVLTIAVPTLINNIDDKKEVASEKVYDLLESAAKNYEIDYNIKGIASIPISDLCGRYIACPIIDPSTNEEIGGYITIGSEEVEILEDVSFSVDFNGGTSTQTFEGAYAPYTTITMVPPTKENFNFSRWAIVKGNGNVDGDKITLGNRDMRIYAVWASASLLEVELNGGTSSQTFESAYESGSTIMLETPTKAGYTFAGWQVTTGNSVVSGSNFTMGSEDTVLEATWSVNTYTYNIEYKSSSGVQLGTSTATYNYETTNTISPKSFTGYTSPSSQSISWDSTTAKTITFTYTPITYTISYTLNSGAVATANKTSYTIETATFTLNNPSRTGYTFKGWTGSNGTTASKSVSITKGSTGNKSYIANWEQNITYLYNAGDECTSLTGGWLYYNGNGETVTKTSSSVIFTLDGNSGRQASFQTTNKIDVTAYKKLVVELNITAINDEWSRLSLGVVTERYENPEDYYTVGTEMYSTNVGTGKTTVTLDISGTTGSYYIAMRADRLDAELTKVYFE